MRKPVHVAGSEYEASAQLKWVFPEFVLLVACGARSFTRLGVVAAQKVEKISGFQLCRLIRLPFFVDEQRKCDSRFLPKLPGVDDVAQANRAERSSFVANRLLVLAQLRDMLAAEDSAVVPQKDNHRRLLVPQRSQPNFVAVAIGQRNERKPVIQRISHAPASCATAGAVSSELPRLLATTACLAPRTLLFNCAQAPSTNPEPEQIHAILK